MRSIQGPFSILVGPTSQLLWRGAGTQQSVDSYAGASVQHSDTFLYLSVTPLLLRGAGTQQPVNFYRNPELVSRQKARLVTSTVQLLLHVRRAHHLGTYGWWHTTTNRLVLGPISQQ